MEIQNTPCAQRESAQPKVGQSCTAAGVDFPQPWAEAAERDKGAVGQALAGGHVEGEQAGAALCDGDHGPICHPCATAQVQLLQRQ